MTDWLRVLASSVLGLLILIVALGTGWIVASRRKLRRFRLTDAQRTAVQDSQRGKRPYWTDPIAKGDHDDVH